MINYSFCRYDQLPVLSPYEQTAAAAMYSYLVTSNALVVGMTCVRAEFAAAIVHTGVTENSTVSHNTVEPYSVKKVLNPEHCHYKGAEPDRPRRVSTMGCGSTQALLNCWLA